MLAASQRAGVPKVVYTSTLAVNSDTHGQMYEETHRHTGAFTSHYDRTKARAHEVAERFASEGLPLVIVQPGVVYGPGDTAQTGTMTDGVTGESYMLAGPRSTLTEVLRRVAAIAGTQGPVVLPTGVVRAAAAVMTVLGRAVPLPPDYAAETMRAGLATYLGT